MICTLSTIVLLDKTKFYQTRYLSQALFRRCKPIFRQRKSENWINQSSFLYKRHIRSILQATLFMKNASGSGSNPCIRRIHSKMHNMPGAQAAGLQYKIFTNDRFSILPNMFSYNIVFKVIYLFSYCFGSIREPNYLNMQSNKKDF